MGNTQDYLREKLGFQILGGYSCGKLGKFNVLLNTNQEINLKEIEILFLVQIQGGVAQLYRELDQYVTQGILKNYHFENNQLKLQYRVENGINGKIDSFLHELESSFIAMDVSNTCSNCEAKDLVDIYEFRNSPMILCGNCKTQSEEKFRSIQEQPNHYGRGMIGALLGSTIGSLVWIAIGALGFYASIGGFVMGYGALFGYRLFKGKETRAAVGIIIGAVLLGLIFAESLGLYIDIQREVSGYSFGQFFYSIPYLFTDREVIAYMLPNIVIGLLFAFLGTFKLIRGMLAQTKNQQDISINKVA